MGRDWCDWKGNWVGVLGHRAEEVHELEGDLEDFERKFRLDFWVLEQEPDMKERVL